MIWRLRHLGTLRYYAQADDAGHQTRTMLNNQADKRSKQLKEAHQEMLAFLEQKSQELIDAGILAPDEKKSFFQSIFDAAQTPAEDAVPVRPTEKRLNESADEERDEALAFAQKLTHLTQLSIDSIPQMIFWVDENARFLNVNRAVCDVLGYSKTELLQMSIFDLDPAFDFDFYQTIWPEIVESRIIYTASEMTTKSGHVFPTEINLNHFNYEGQQIVVAFVQDVTEKLAANHQLQIAQFAVENSGDRILRFSEDGSITWANQTAWEGLGYTREEFLQLKVFDINPAIEPHWPQIWEDVKETGFFLDEAVQHHKDGHIIPIEVVSSFRVFDEQEYIFAFARDVTERKKAQQALVEKQQELERVLNQLQTMQDHSSYGIFFVDSDLNLIASNRKVHEIFELPDNFLDSKPHVEDVIIHIRNRGLYKMQPEEWESYISPRVQFIRQAENERLEVELTNGRSYSFQIITLPNRNKMLTYYDITEQKEAERLLQESEEQIRQVLDQLPIPVSISGRDGRFDYVNLAFANVFEAPREDFQEKITGRDIYSDVKWRNKLWEALNRDGVAQTFIRSIRSRTATTLKR